MEGDEIEAFLKDLLKADDQTVSPQRISDYKNFIVRISKIVFFFNFSFHVCNTSVLAVIK